MAPEVHRGDPYGRFCDIWSLGCVVVEMATGKPPWHFIEQYYAFVQKITKQNKLPDLPNHLSRDCRDFLAQCLKTRPSKRANVYELLQHTFITDRRKNSSMTNPTEHNSTRSIVESDANWEGKREEEDEDEGEGEEDGEG